MKGTYIIYIKFCIWYQRERFRADAEDSINDLKLQYVSILGMASFLKLSSMVINVAHIQKVIIKESKYRIHLNSVDIDGFMIAASGGVYSSQFYVDVCKKKELHDYIVVNKWLESITPWRMTGRCVR